ncbi:MAG TPA: DUF3572 domain-containing protein [Magnetospirillaceae bacterium]|nr:DUF3572 domain-containing protein [Magnetospirillaceae bacterium]
MDPFKPYTPSKRSAGPPVLSAEDAQTIALKAIAFIATDDELLSRFVALTGCGMDDIRSRIGDPGFLGGVLDFVLADEPTLLAFVAREEMVPETPMAARHKLP